MLVDEENGDMTLCEQNQAYIANGEKMIEVPVVHKLYPQCALPNKEVVDDLYASFIAEHAQQLSSFLQHTRQSDIEGDEEYVLEVLQMILKKTDELIPEAQVDSTRYVVGV